MKHVEKTARTSKWNFWPTVFIEKVARLVRSLLLKTPLFNKTCQSDGFLLYRNSSEKMQQ